MIFREPQVNVYVADPERVAAFYRGVFGFEETFRTPTTGHAVHIELRLDGFVLGFADAAAGSGMHSLDLRPGHPSAEVLLWTDDTDAAYAHAIANGATSLSAPHDFLGRLRAAWVADPEGNPVELVQKLG